MSRLAGLAGMGQTATGQQVATEGTGLQGQLQTRMGAYGGQYGSAGTIGQGDIAAANAMAAGSNNLLKTGFDLGGKIIGAATGMPSFGMPSFGGGSYNGMYPEVGTPFGSGGIGRA
jgi:hypothetical protein